MDGLGHTVSNFSVSSTGPSLNNIGLFPIIGAGGVVKNLTLDNIHVTANSNVSGPGQFVGILAGQNRGTIINVASRDGLSASAGYAAYSASKSAVLRLTESLAAELKASDINVNCIRPGTSDTPQNRAAVPDGDFSKWVEPAAIADVILFLSSDASRAINGAALPVYGKG